MMIPEARYFLSYCRELKGNITETIRLEGAGWHDQSLIVRLDRSGTSIPMTKMMTYSSLQSMYIRRIFLYIYIIVIQISYIYTCNFYNITN